MKRKFIFIACFIFIILIGGCISNNNRKKQDSHLKKVKEFKVKNINFELYKKNLIATAIIGCGPAGCSAALKCARMGVKTVVFGYDAGQLGTTGYVENIPGVPTLKGADIIKNMKEQA